MPAPAGRVALLDAALGLFAERGFEGASTRAIAERAGVPQGLVRHHFGSKEALYREVVEQGLSVLAQGFAASKPTSPETVAGVALLAAPLLSMLTHALLEPGARRDWLVEQRLRPLLQRSGPALASFLARPPPLGERDALALLGALLGPLLLAPLLAAPADSGSQTSGVLERLLHQSLVAVGGPGTGGPWALRGAAATRRH